MCLIYYVITLSMLDITNNTIKIDGPDHKWMHLHNHHTWAQAPNILTNTVL